MLKSLMLARAAEALEKEKVDRQNDKQNFMVEHVPEMSLSGVNLQKLMELCREMHTKSEQVDEERYDIEYKVLKSNKEIEDLNQKIFDLKGKFKRPQLKRVRMSADAMLRALLGSKHKVSMDLRANLKSVKKEDSDKEKHAEVGDWRKNIEAMSGMEGRKKRFDTANQ
ncbi:troponin I, slow skeletal muscle-like isoform X1 [Petromyzon marinus]